MTKTLSLTGGKIRKREKKPSKKFRNEFGHMPLSIAEDILWAWEDEISLMNFVQQAPHAEIMDSLAPRMDRTRFVRWSTI